MNDKIKNLQEQIEVEKQKIDNCDHKFGEPFSNPEIKKEEYLTGEYENHGVHHHPITAFRDKTVSRWTKVCELCGREEHTNKQKPVIKGYEPDF